MQIKLTEQERERLGHKIEEVVDAAKADNDSRIRRYERYLRRWRNLTEEDDATEADLSNFNVPMIQWHTLGRLGQTMQRIFGEDAEIICEPVGPSDYRRAPAVQLYQNWRLFKSMKIVNPLTVFIFREILLGRSIAYRPWVRETYETDQGEQVWYEGPGFFPLDAGDIITPAEEVSSIQEFSWVVRKCRVTPDDLLKGEADGRYFGIDKDFEEFVKAANTNSTRDEQDTSDVLRDAQEAAEGVDTRGESGTGKLVMWEWYGRHRMPKGKKDSEFDEFDSREKRETEIVVYYMPSMHRIIGVQSLVALYPKMKNRRPFAEASLIKDGRYWSAGFGELLESIEDEATANHRLFTDAGKFSVGPVVFYRADSGYNPKTFRYAPYQAIPSENPAGINVVNMRADLNFPIANGQVLHAIGERVTGYSDQQGGRASSAPNAPKTATGTIALLEKGDVRTELDVMGLREDLRVIIQDLWQLDCDMAPKSVFFRVTEEEAAGIMDVRNGGAVMTSRERAGRYDFDIKFATPLWNREQQKQSLLALYQLLVTTNPAFATNQQLMAVMAKKIAKALGQDEIAALIPMPPAQDLPRTPQEEWTMILQGEGSKVRVNPADNDDQHLEAHMRQLEEAEADQPDARDVAAERELRLHIQDTQQQRRMKQMTTALTQHLVNTVAENVRTNGPGLSLPAAPLPLQKIHAVTGDLMAQASGMMPETSGN